METETRMAEALDLLTRMGADKLPHPGGTLLAHLQRVADMLRSWNADHDVRLVGLCHATYGTDVFPDVLLPLDRRLELRQVIGQRSESWVYRYGSCDRRATYPRLGLPGPLVFTDRFTGVTEPLDDAEAAVFMEVTAANELDIARVNPAWGQRHGPELRDLFTAGHRWLSRAARQERLAVLKA